MGSLYRLLTVALLALVTIIAFEAMAISTAMPAVAKDLDAVKSYGLAFSFMLTAEMLGIVVAGVWADRRGPLPSLFAGQLLMAAGSAMAGLAPTFTVLLAGRLVAGLGAGLIVVALYVVIGRAYPDALRPRVFSWVSAAWVLPSLIGPPIAGWLTSTWSWRWVFLIVLAPIAVTFAVVSTQRTRINAGASAGGTAALDQGAAADPSVPADRPRHRRLALLGLGVAVSAGAMQWGSTQLAAGHRLPVIITALGLVGIGATAPRLVPAGTLLMSRGLPAVMMSRFLLTASFNGALTFVPLMLVNERHLSLTTAGVMLTVGALGWSFGSFVQGHQVMHNRRSELVAAGGASPYSCSPPSPTSAGITTWWGLPLPCAAWAWGWPRHRPRCFRWPFRRSVITAAHRRHCRCPTCSAASWESQRPAPCSPPCTTPTARTSTSSSSSGCPWQPSPPS
jgi:MFS family permease